MVDRSVHGLYENYRTPEQHIPEEPLDYPWETCLTMGDSWSYVPGDKYKSTHTLIHLLVDIVSKGGNLLLNVGPDPYGDLDPVAYSRMKEIGEWMKINSEAIYKTRPMAPFKYGKVCFTQLKNGTVYAIYLCDEAETKMPETILLPDIKNIKTGKIELLGHKTKVALTKTSAGYQINIPKSLQDTPPCKNAWVFKLQ
jgi:alpha-L-fucosidase